MNAPNLARQWSLEDLRVFCAVAETGSLSAAVEVVNLSLAAISGRIKQLEDALGCTLFARTNRGVSLNPAGHRLLAHARELLEKAALMSEDLQDYGQGGKGLVRIAANTTSVTEYLPDILASFLSTHPKIDIALTEAVSSEVVRQVRDGRADFGIYTPPLPVDDLESLPFRQDQLVLIVASYHVWAKRESMAFHETLVSDHVCLQPSAALYGYLKQRAQDVGLRLKSRIHLAGFDAIARLVSKQVGVAVIPQSAATRLMQQHIITVVKLTDTWAHNELYLCIRDRAALTGAAQNLIHELVKL
jgi:DNA-binding transcriptional LysR family regulator